MKPKGLFVLERRHFHRIYGPDAHRRLAEFVDLPPASFSPEEVRSHPGILRDVELIFSGWGAPRLDEAFLEAAPRLRAFFYGAGSIKYIVTDAFWRKEIPIVTAQAANAVPVAEIVLAQIILSLKRAWPFMRGTRQWITDDEREEIPGAYRSTVGIVSMGMIGRLLRKKLRAFDLDVLAYDPFLDDDRAAELGVERCSLEELFERSDVVTLHAPELPSTEGMITGRLLESMKPHASFINTARGSIVNEPEMIEVLARRPDLIALLDVTCVEPPLPGSPLLTLPNVVRTPHIAGSQGRECLRMGHWMIEEARRFVNGQPLQWRVTDSQQAAMA